MIQKRKIKYALIKLNMILQNLRHNLQQLLNNLPEIIKENLSSHSSQGFAKYVKLYVLPNYQVTCTRQNMYAIFRSNNHLSTLHSTNIYNRANNKNM